MIMEFFSNMLSLQLMLFTLILVGVLIQRCGLLTVNGRKTLSALLINVILPCNIVHAFIGGVEVSQKLFLHLHCSLLLQSPCCHSCFNEYF